jgi:ElaB/YqjD/DUF883 family membrane-anchored ribosome-binding protein
MMERTAEQSAVLADELRKVVLQAEGLLQALSEDKNEAVGVLRERVRASIESAKARLSEIEQQAAAMAQRASISTQAYVRENPWTITGGALATGLVLGAAFVGCLRRGRSSMGPSSAGDSAVS